MNIPKIKTRTYCEHKRIEAQHHKASPLQADIIARRTAGQKVKVSDLLNLQVDTIDAGLIKDIDKAASRIAKAHRRGEVIALLCDFKTESMASAAIVDGCLADHLGFSPSKIKTIISNRTKSGFGTSDELIKRLLSLQPAPTLVIALNLDSISNNHIDNYNNSMIARSTFSDVIVCSTSDNNPTNPLSSAHSLINPRQSSCNFQDKEISGSLVALLLMTRVRKILIDKKELKSAHNLGALLPFGACAAISGNASLLSPINRAFIKFGFRNMNSNRIPSWNAYKKHYLNKHQVITSSAITSNLTADIDSCSRAGENGYAALKFFRAEDEREAARFLMCLSETNPNKDRIDISFLQTADYIAKRELVKGGSTAVVYLTKGNRDSQQLITKSLSDKYGRPISVLVPGEVREEELSTESLIAIKCPLFNGMERRSVLQTKVNAADKLQSYLSSKDIEVNSEFIVEARKRERDYHPEFELFSLTPYQSLGLIDMKLAASITKKSSFQGIKRGVYKFESELGEVTLDLSSPRIPKLLVSSVSELTAEIADVNGLKAQKIIQLIQKKHPNLQKDILISQRGGSFKIRLDEVDVFTRSLESAVNTLVDGSDIELGVSIDTDGPIPSDRNIDLSMVDEIRQLEPYGAEFPYPSFTVSAQALSVLEVGSDLHLKLEFSGSIHSSIWLNYKDSLFDTRIELNKTYQFVVEPHDMFDSKRRSTLLILRGLN